VTLVSGAEAAEADEALYTITSGEVVLIGNVLLTQGGGTMSGQKLTVDLTTGTGHMEGRVRTVLNPGGN
jgi:lipopolysaccharide export system protein LptA